MRAAVVESMPGVPVISDVAVSEPGLGEVLVRTVATGVCHSDLHALVGKGATYPTPFVLGHEPAGVVEAVGPGVRHVSPGDHVVACLSVFCGHCERCLTGRPYQCFTDEWARRRGDPPRLHRDGRPMHQHVGLGGFAEQMLVGQNTLVRIRPDLPLERACLLGCGVLTGVGAVLNTAQVPAGARVAVIGCGGVGLSVVQGARLVHAATIVAVDVDDTKLDLARRLGATDTVNATRDDPVAAVQQLTRGGADHVFEAIGNEATVQQGVGMLGYGGTLTVVGILDPEASIMLSGVELLKGKKVQQSLMGSNRFVVDVPRLVEHALAGRLDLEHLVSVERPLEELPAALEELQAGKVLGRTVITL